MSDSAQDRTLPATARKISKAREQGQVARSRDLGHFAALFAASLALVAVSSQLTGWLQRMLPRIQVDPETYEVRADGVLLVCEPAKVLPMAQRYFLL